jgi:hypothetical protein
MEQTKYEEEDRRLAAERKALAEALPPLFECGICLDEHLEDSAAQISQCRFAGTASENIFARS